MLADCRSPQIRGGHNCGSLRDTKQEKLALQQQYNDRQREAPVELARLNAGDDLQYRQVLVDGTWDSAHVFLLDNRIYQGQAGYEVLVPMHSSAGPTVFINRGWIPQGRYRDQLPNIEPLEGTSQIHGSIYVPVGAAFMLGEEQTTDSWPRVIQSAAPQALAPLAGYGTNDDIFPYIVRLGEGAPGAFTRYWPVISTTPEKHRGYAVQWFAMALMLLGLYLFYSTRAEEADAGND